MPDLRQSLKDFVATANSGKYSDEATLLSKFPELKGYDINALKDFVATANSGKYINEDELFSKFPEFNIGGLKDTSKKKGDTVLSSEDGSLVSLRIEPQRPVAESTSIKSIAPIPTVKKEKKEEIGTALNVIGALNKGVYNFFGQGAKGLGTALQGATAKIIGGDGRGFISDALINVGDRYLKAIDELNPQDEEFKGSLTDQFSQALGQVGAAVLTGGLSRGAAAASAIQAAPKAVTLGMAAKQLASGVATPTGAISALGMGQSEFDRAKEAGATDEQAFESFYKNAITGSVLETIPVMQFFKRFNNATAGGVINYLKTKAVGGITGGIEEMTTEVLQQLYANKTAQDIYNVNQNLFEGVGESGGIGFGVGFLLNAMGANAKILRKQGREKEADVLENQVKQYEDNIENPKVTSDKKIVVKDLVTQGVEIGTQKAVQSLDRDLANGVITPEQYQEGIIFAEKAAQVVDKIPETVTGESRAKSMELLVERNDISYTSPC